LNKVREEKAKAESRATDFDFKMKELQYELEHSKSEFA
jgi:hypothetical protein